MVSDGHCFGKKTLATQKIQYGGDFSRWPPLLLSALIQRPEIRQKYFLRVTVLEIGPGPQKYNMLAIFQDVRLYY